MPEPGLFTKLSDSFVVSCKGGVRVRVWQHEGGAQAMVLGRMKRIAPERLMALVLELKPEGSGAVHFHYLGNRNWKIRVSRSLAGDNLEQRLRNVVVNS